MCRRNPLGVRVPFCQPESNIMKIYKWYDKETDTVHVNFIDEEATEIITYESSKDREERLKNDK